MTYQIEITDTFAGEANYSWVKREQFDATPHASRLSLVRRAKRIAGWNGVRCKVENYGDIIRIEPRGACLVAFVNWIDA